jgi:putative membrane protein
VEDGGKLRYFCRFAAASPANGVVMDDSGVDSGWGNGSCGCQKHATYNCGGIITNAETPLFSDRHPTKGASKLDVFAGKYRPARQGRTAMYHYYWGMYGYWWIFWILIWIAFFLFLIPIRRSTWAAYHRLETPMQVLQRRYAAGEVTSEEYEERRAKLLRDAESKDVTKKQP